MPQNVLHVFFNNEPCGILESVSHGHAGYHLEFSYLPNWKKFPLSPHLPLGEIHSGYPVWYFFRNLMPEGKLLEVVACAMNMSQQDVFRFLSAFGKDCPGAISLHRESSLPAPSYVSLDIERLRRYLPDGPPDPKAEYISAGPQKLYFFGGKPRMSLAGAKDKLGIALDSDGSFLLPEGSAPSTHIIKSACSAEYPYCVLNEHIIMSLAHRMGLPVARTEIISIPEKILLVERFDRKDGKRIHQIDGCQFFGELPDRKYESTVLGPVGLNAEHFFEFARACNAEEIVLRWLIFNFLSGNTDCHAKNISCFVNENGYELTPFYDLLCTAVYGQYEMAFSIGGEDHLGLIDRDRWQELALTCKLDEDSLFTTMLEMASAMPEAFRELKDSLSLSEDERAFASELEKLIQKQCQQAAQYAVLNSAPCPAP